MGGDEVLQDRKTFPEAGPDREGDNAASGVRHETSHTNHLLDLGDVTLSARSGHEENATVLREVFINALGHVFATSCPDLYHSPIALFLRDEPPLELPLK